MTIPRRSSRRTYNRVVSGDNPNGPTSLSAGPTALNEPLAPDSPAEEGNGNATARENANRPDPPARGERRVQPSSSPLVTPPTANADLNSNDPDDVEKLTNPINVTILDSAQSKFRISASADWTVGRFKVAGLAVHRVPPKSQRLIYLGKLLRDEQTLRECGIDVDDKIVHLFPKPNVVVTNEAETSAEEENDAGDDSGGGAHVPQIVLDAAEAERRSQILVLSSNEIFEAQHRVKLLSFLLLIISSMELLTLFTILLGVPTDDPDGGNDDFIPPGDPTDSGGGNDNNGMDEVPVRTWQTSDYADLAISSFGFYVATLGIKATTENTLQLARRYFYCLLIVGVAWCSYYFVLNVRAERKAAERDGESYTEGELRGQAMFAILLPVFVWLICFLRAWQFQRLIHEAEVEAGERAERLRAEEEEQQRQGDEEASSSEGVEVVVTESGGQGRRSGREVPYGSGEDLVLQVEGRVIT